jgi:hypothetical protein
MTQLVRTSPKLTLAGEFHRNAVINDVVSRFNIKLKTGISILSIEIWSAVYWTAMCAWWSTA